MRMVKFGGGILVAVSIVSILSLVATPGLANETDKSRSEQTHFTPEERIEIENLVRDFITRHPEIVGEAMHTVIQRQQEAEEARLRQNTLFYGAVLANQELGLERGNPQGDVLVVEFADYNCGWCKRAHQGVLDAVAEDGNVRFLYREFPVLGPISEFASKMALAIPDQEMYGDFNNRLMLKPGKISEASIADLAEMMNMDVEALMADMDSPQIAETLTENLKIAEILGIRGTPAFLVGDRLYRGYLDQEELTQAIALARSDVLAGNETADNEMPE